jgi:hypothetical protein
MCLWTGAIEKAQRCADSAVIGSKNDVTFFRDAAHAMRSGREFSVGPDFFDAAADKD